MLEFDESSAVNLSNVTGSSIADASASVVGDDSSEPEETFTVILSDPTNAVPNALITCVLRVESREISIGISPVLAQFSSDAR